MNHTKIILLAFILSVQIPSHSFAIEKTITGLASSASDFAKGIGQKAGIGLPKEKIDETATAALKELLKQSPAALELSKKAKAILVFPMILKAGLGVGGHYGEGVLRKEGKTVSYSNTVAGSYGLQIGGQSFGYAMFFMDDKGLDYLLDNNDGWEVGVGPSVVLIDEGMAKTMNNTTLTESVYVFTFNQNGLMAGAGIQGSKITKMNP
mgnify:CR=1 FL=1